MCVPPNSIVCLIQKTCFQCVCFDHSWTFNQLVIGHLELVTDCAYQCEYSAHMEFVISVSDSKHHKIMSAIFSIELSTFLPSPGITSCTFFLVWHCKGNSCTFFFTAQMKQNFIAKKAQYKTPVTSRWLHGRTGHNSCTFVA